MKISKFLRTASAALLCAGLLMTCGCSIRFGTTPQAGDVVAKPFYNSEKDLEITYGEFEQQYKYFLMQYGIEDDNDPDYADTCREQRQTIIDSLILNKIYLKKAQEMNIPELTEEERAKVSEDLNSQFEQQAKYFGEKALGVEKTDGSSDPPDSSSDTSGSSSDSSSGSSGESSSGSSSDSSGGSSTSSPTNEEILEKGYEELDKMLKDCGITRNDLLRWNEDYLRITKVMDEIVKDITMEAAEERAKLIIPTLEEMYNSDNIQYYFYAGYDKLWVPEGSRRIKQVLLGFDSETRTQIDTLRKDGKNDEADALIAEKREELSDKIAEVEKMLDEGVDFNTILLNHSADAAESSLFPDGYLVAKDDTHYTKEFVDAAFSIEKEGDRTVCTSDYGVHIVIYIAAAKPDEDALKEFTNSVYSQLRQTEVEKKTEEWKTAYSYEIDREKLRIELESSSSGSSEASAS